ncbi:hypothetical protein [Meiothermus sp.]|uniref:hypothetical protein n=1 Tax=Meiothermus sp. TaxID=1955249 RepID=UPI00298F229C|nr:hypothetical protein [Meiothermus sp.]MCS7067260.1 hypothetical protein [Meiothermus sp.]
MIVAPKTLSNLSEVFFWVIENQDELVELSGKLSNLIVSILEEGGSIHKVIRRIGQSLIWFSSSGKKVLGNLEDLRASPDFSQSLSIVALGFTGISASMLVAQFLAQAQRLNAIQKELRKIQIKIDNLQESKLKAALDYLRQAEAAQGSRRVEYFWEAIRRARDVGHFYSALALDASIHEQNPVLLQFYARKYFLALFVEISGLINNNELADARVRIDSEEHTLKHLAHLIYDLTLRDRLDEYLAPELVSSAPLTQLEEVYSQAALLGCLEDGHNFDIRLFIDRNRMVIFNSNPVSRLKPGYIRFKRTAKDYLTIAQTTFEEINRILSWRETVSKFIDNNINAIELRQRVEHEKRKLSENPSDYMIYGF